MRADLSREKVETENLDVPDCFSLGERVVLYPVRDLFGQNHKVYFENYFSSVPLADHGISKAILSSCFINGWIINQ